ncbi:hypothetical protein ACQKPX_02240 [Photobacterium sp. DNB23_23_1]|uniref:Uncharacterized protein n=1 Tax=Photobacterium pectinilyticum TaxID=2906793 RepID=A0ABT1N2J1_9GAMM|nr:hypothetical protein [Photobacterium sp. ZSDE20]MCQ1058757.1 hypothetical protein [Photobacterium sp. ZSDE20]MDD1823539.1 hypothetical protein [Photobacterium sp. ZSDE20]
MKKARCKGELFVGRQKKPPENMAAKFARNIIIVMEGKYTQATNFSSANRLR